MVHSALVPQLQYFFVVDVPVVQVHPGSSSDKVVDMPVIVNDRVLYSGGAFQLCNTDGYDSSSIFAYGGDDGLFDAFCVIFRAPPAMPELSASFSSFRALTPVSARGLQGCRSRREFTPR